ncbi:MAG TPA: signal peptidase II [Alphaproteobacteria bacterium]|nr:signal peptidase II [Alphaproteobacteria bacterium]
MKRTLNILTHYVQARRKGLLVGAGILAADWATKFFIVGASASLPWWVVRDWFALVRWNNRGMSFSLLDDAVWGPVFLSVLAVAACAAFIHWLGSATRHWQQIGLGLLLGGALGNLLDRLTHGAVIDFVLLCAPNIWCFYAFNVADAAITLGVVALLWDNLRYEGRQ